MRPVTVIHKPDPIRRLPQPDQLPARKLTTHNTVTAVMPMAPAAEKIVEAVIFLQDDDDVSDWTHRRCRDRARPTGSSRGQLRKNRDEHGNPDQSPESHLTGPQITREG